LFLASNTDYFYKVVQIIGNIKIESDIVAGQFQCSEKISGLVLTGINCNSIDLSWNPTNGQGKYTQFYQVLRSNNGINGAYNIQYNYSNNSYGKDPFYKDYIDLQPGKTYFYKVRSFIDFVSTQLSDPIEVKLGGTLNTTKSGSWTNPTVWSCGRIPTSLDDIIISEGHSISVDQNVIGNAKNLTNNGQITFGIGANLILHTP
jgi:hypothetical protein